MRKITLLLLMAFVSAGLASAALPFDKYTINREDLPEEAQKTLSEHFPKSKVSMIKVDRHLLKKTDYDVKLVNGTKIEFNNSGKWTSVDCKKRAVPEKMIPSYITKRIAKEFPDNKIVRITKKSGSHEVGLCNGTAVKFNAIGQYKGIISGNDVADDAEETTEEPVTTDEAASAEEEIMAQAG